MSDHHPADHQDCLNALAFVRRAFDQSEVSASTAPPPGNSSHFTPSEIRDAAQALEFHGLAHVARRPDGTPERMTLTRSGSRIGRRLVEGGCVVLFPASGRVRAIAWPPFCRAQVGEGDRPDLGHALDVPARIMAEAPSYYDARDVEGSGTEVILVPMARGFPPAIRLGPARIDVSRAWEVFGRSGRSYGVVVLAEERFVGIRPDGGLDPEPSLSGAAWQLRVN